MPRVRIQAVSQLKIEPMANNEALNLTPEQAKAKAAEAAVATELEQKKAKAAATATELEQARATSAATATEEVKEKAKAAAAATELEQAKATAAATATEQAKEKAKAAVASLEKEKKRPFRELKALLEEHRRRYSRGKKIWRTLSLLLIHLLALATVGAIFVWKSETLKTANSPITKENGADLLFGLILVLIVSLPLLLEYMRNWRNHRVAVTKVDRLIVDLTNEEPNVTNTSTELKTIIEKDLEFFRR